MEVLQEAVLFVCAAVLSKVTSRTVPAFPTQPVCIHFVWKPVHAWVLGTLPRRLGEYYHP